MKKVAVHSNSGEIRRYPTVLHSETSEEAGSFLQYEHAIEELPRVQLNPLCYSCIVILTDFLLILSLYLRYRQWEEV